MVSSGRSEAARRLALRSTERCQRTRVGSRGESLRRRRAFQLPPVAAERGYRRPAPCGWAGTTPAWSVFRWRKRAASAVAGDGGAGSVASAARLSGPKLCAACGSVPRSLSLRSLRSFAAIDWAAVCGLARIEGRRTACAQMSAAKERRERKDGRRRVPVQPAARCTGPSSRSSSATRRSWAPASGGRWHDCELATVRAPCPMRYAPCRLLPEPVCPACLCRFDPLW